MSVDPFSARHRPDGAIEALWDSINKTPGTRWADNPEVW
jgi:hypothetical protein